MKTKELIKQLNDCDPSGELECCVENEDIYYVDVTPAYYNGRLQVLIREPRNENYYNIIGGKYFNEGKKVDIKVLSIEDIVLEDPDIPIEIPEGDISLKNLVEGYREEGRKIRDEILLKKD